MISIAFAKGKTHRNPHSGHTWEECGPIIGYEVHGGLWCRQRFQSMQAAQAEQDLRDSIDRLMVELKLD